MIDLFGQNLEIYRGQPVASQSFSPDEAQTIVDEMVFEGLLLKQMTETLMKLKLLSGRNCINETRREAWEELMWVFDLWHSPANVPFDVACDASGADSENLRGAISHAFAGEIELMFNAIIASHPEERQWLARKLARYITFAPQDGKATVH